MKIGSRPNIQLDYISFDMGGPGGNANTQVLKITNIGLTWDQLSKTVSHHHCHLSSCDPDF